MAVEGVAGARLRARAQDEDIFRDILDNGRPDMSGDSWAHVSEPAKVRREHAVV
jgi:hypothetical protein